ncbi:MAG: DUF6761 family protein [Geitlerinemataceae cyanobacterium]
MLRDPATIRHYQNLTDTLVNLWERGYRADDFRMYLDGYLDALRRSNTIEIFQLHRLEEEAVRFINDPSNFQASYY